MTGQSLKRAGMIFRVVLLAGKYVSKSQPFPPEDYVGICDTGVVPSADHQTRTCITSIPTMYGVGWMSHHAVVNKAFMM